MALSIWSSLASVCLKHIKVQSPVTTQTPVSLVSVMLYRTLSKKSTDFQKLNNRVDIMVKTFQAPVDEVRKFLQENSSVARISDTKFQEMSNILSRIGILPKELFTYPEIFHRKVETIESRVALLQKHGISDITLTMISTTKNKFEKRLPLLLENEKHRLDYPSHVEMMSDVLQCSKEEAKFMLKQYSSLSDMKMTSLKHKIDTIASFGVQLSAIRDKIYLLTFSTEKIVYQLEKLQEHGFCLEELLNKHREASIKHEDLEFESYLKQIIENRKILGDCKTKEEYLSKRLNCSVDDFKYNPLKKLLAIGLPKLKCHLDLVLNECQMNTSDIVARCFFLHFSNENIQRRVEQLENLGMMVTPYVLSLTNRKFEKFIGTADGS